MSAWTEKEIRTLRQNMHFKPSGIRSVIPGRSVAAIRHQRNHMLTKNTLSAKDKTRPDIFASFIRRGWSPLNANRYLQACTGDRNALNTLKQHGLWDMKCEGVMV